MAKIIITDTGWLTSDRTGTQNSGTSIVSLSNYRCKGRTSESDATIITGGMIILNCNEINLVGGTQMADEPNPSSGDSTAVHFNTFENELYEIPFLIDVTDTTEKALLKEIRALHKTSGVKLIYASDVATTIKTLPELLGRTDTRFHGHEVISGLPAFVCRAKGIRIRNKSDSRKYSVSGTITFEEEKVVPA